MVQAPLQAALSGPTLVRLLARLAEADVSGPQQPLADRLSQWLGWTDAIGLSTALNAPLNAQPREGAARPAMAPSFDREDAALVVNARSALTKAITRACAPPDTRRGARANAHPNPGTDPDAPADYAELRQDYLSIQQMMETEVGQLRGRLRALLAAQTPALARLAAVDAIMERSLGAREQRVLATIPALLGTHFERLRRAGQQALADAEASGDNMEIRAETDAANNAANTAIMPGAWLAAFRKDMQSVLLAELDIRFQPVQGLLAALRAR
ncbi:DUF3348 domain-containing protein [Paraburkholderia sp. J12]|uniref:DUF3348 domain-containing protein n=1 Tax=Paraburkholderia sp. J12 TaxID=2805432 RepID=UPI002ABDEE91|nr:DUF3348 domain-containing protein [Paraburkholderia sp. J12]